MPRIASWNEFPSAVRAHLVERMAQREISIQDLNLLRLWIEICGTGKYPKTFLLAGQAAKGTRL